MVSSKHTREHEHEHTHRYKLVVLDADYVANLDLVPRFAHQPAVAQELAQPVVDLVIALVPANVIVGILYASDG